MWAALGICAVLVLGAMALLTRNVRATRQERAAAEARAELEEQTRLSLWRLDAAGAAVLLRENQRPPADYGVSRSQRQSRCVKISAAAREETIRGITGRSSPFSHQSCIFTAGRSTRDCRVRGSGSSGAVGGGHIDGAISIPVQQLAGRMDELRDKTTQIVVYCQSGGRSAMAKRLLESNGFTNVHDMGGIAQW